MTTNGFSKNCATLALLASAVAGCGRSAPTPQASSQQAAESKPQANVVDKEVRMAKAEAPLLPAAPAPAETEPAAQADPPQVVADRQETGKLPTAKASIPYGETPEAELTMPRVSLSEGHAKICQVRVGDAFPDLTLADLLGQTHSLSKLLGPKLTVVMFWSGTKPTARQQLADLEPEVAARFSAEGVAVVGVNAGDEPQLAKELAEQAGAAFTILSDRDGATLKQVAPGRIPCTYLVDAAGKVLWFDIEYSRTTRRELVEAIRYTLAHR